MIATARSPSAGADLDEVGQIEFARRVICPDRLKPLDRAIARDRHRPGVAAPDRALGRARILLLADRDQRAVALDKPAIALGIGRLEAEHGERRPVRQPRAQARERLPPE